MVHSYLILDDDSKSILKIQSVMERFSNFQLMATASNYEDGLDAILEFQPDFVFLEINPLSPSSNLSLLLINELHRFLNKIPKIIAISHDTSKAFEAVKYDVLDFLVKPFSEADVRKALLRFEKNNDIPVIRLNPEPRKITDFKIVEPKLEVQEENNLAKELIQIEEDSIPVNPVNEELITLLKTELSGLKEAILELANQQKPMVDSKAITSQIVETLQEALPKGNTTIDLEPILSEIKNITIETPKTIVANDEVHRNLICIKSYGDYRFLELDEIAFLKADNNSTDITLNNGEVITAFKTLKYFEENLPSYFFRIHNSYIVNKNYVSRIHTGNTVCYIKNAKTQLPFSKSYKDNVEQIIAQLAGSEFKDI